MVEEKQRKETRKERNIRNIIEILARNSERYSKLLLSYAVGLEKTVHKE